MEVKEITDKNQWEVFLLGCSRKTFLQSWNWGEFQQSLGNSIWRMGIFDGNMLVAAALTIKHTAKRGSFLLVPHGPVIMERGTGNMEQVLRTLTDFLKIKAQEGGVDFIRVSPIIERTTENEKPFRDLGFRLRPLHTHPESSWKLDIEKPEEELFGLMRKTTRYLIRQAEKNTDLEVRQSFDIADVTLFNTMHREVVRRQKFVPFSLEYFKKEFSAFAPDNQIALFFAYWQGKPIAASYGIFWSEMAFYHHAALLPEYKKIPASYLLQWEAIKEANRRGCKVYDFWGYSDPVKNPKHPYSGPTLFKMGFGGYKDEYVKTQDLAITPKYWLNYAIESVRRMRRGL
ncbi:MAG: lipid II:glycine glycyltransferase FemX [Candidatus Saccharimonadales bacterium]